MYQRVAARRRSKGFCVQAKKAMAKFTQQDHCLKSPLRVKPPREILSEVASVFIPNMLNDVLFLGRQQKKHCGFYCLSSTSFTQDLMSSHKICFNHLFKARDIKNIIFPYSEAFSRSRNQRSLWTEKPADQMLSFFKVIALNLEQNTTLKSNTKLCKQKRTVLNFVQGSCFGW